MALEWPRNAKSRLRDFPLNIKPQPMKNNYSKMPSNKSAFSSNYYETKVLLAFRFLFAQESLTLLRYNYQNKWGKRV